jgi:hypothetical protein
MPIDDAPEFTTEQYPIRLRPLPQLRVNNVIGGLFIAAAGAAGIWGGFAVGVAVHQGWIIVALGVPFALYGLWVTPRSLLLEVVLTEDRAVVRGILCTVRVPRDSIRGITAYPSILWTDAGGRSRRTQVNALNVYRSGRASPNARILARVQAQQAVLEHWAARQP